MGRRSAIVALTGLVLLAGCSPCAGVVGCEETTQVAVVGRVLVRETGSPVAGATITLLAINGADIDSTQGSTDRFGSFQLRLDPGVTGRLAMRVSATGFPQYTIDSLPCAPVKITGDACVLEPILPAPAVPIHALITYRGSQERVVARPVRFNRTGGSAWVGENASESIASGTDSSGVANLFPPLLYATSLDPVVGDLVVTLPAPYGTSVRRGFLVRPVYRFNDRPVDIFGVGPSLDYRLAFIDSATLLPLSGVAVEYRRTSGVETDRALVESTSDAAGLAAIAQRPLAVGVVQGTLTIRGRPGGGPTAFAGFSLETFDTDSSRVAGKWTVGATGVLYAVPSPPQP